MARYLLIWCGIVVSSIGSGLTSFALGVWVFDRTGSVTQYAMIGVVALTPALLVTPFAGVVIDRTSRKMVLILSNSVPVLTTLAALLLHRAGALTLWHILVIAGINSVCGAFLWLAFTTSTTLLVPKRQLGRASGLAQVGQGLSRIAAPVVAGVLVARFGLSPILLIDTLTFIIAILTAAVVSIPNPQGIHGEHRSGPGDVLFGVRYIRARKGLLVLLCYFAAINFAIAIAVVLLTPLVLLQASSAVLGTILSSGGAGMLVGSIVVSIWGGPRRRVRGVLVCGLIVSLLICLGGLRSTPGVLGVGAFLILLISPVITASSQVIWQTKVPADLQGRVFSIRAVLAMAAMPIAFLAAGPLADHVFEPAMADGGALASSLGRVLGAGRGRGMSAMLLLAGIVPVIATVAGSLHPRLRRLESEIPDALPDGQDNGTEKENA